MLWLWAVFSWLSVAWGTEGTEFVLILDNSCSMIAPTQGSPPADPLRQSVLGALVIEGLTRNSADALTVLAMDRHAPDRVRRVEGYHNVRDLADSGGTYYLGPLKEARRILEESSRADRILLFLSDGAPTDYRNPLRGRRVLGLDEPEVGFETLVIGLMPDANARSAAAFLKPLALRPENWVAVDDGADLVSHFTQAYAQSLGSKALTGTLGAGDKQTIDVGRYVTEVMVITASTSPSGPYEARLAGPEGPVPLRAQGNNGCNLEYSNAPGLCDPPRMHFKVWRTPHNPHTRAQYELSVPSTRDDVVYGVILRYDLAARLDVPASARTGEVVPIEAHLMWRGETFDDEDFFAADGFKAVARVAGQQIPLTRGEGGRFTGTWTPMEPSNGVPLPVRVEFRNNWMSEAVESGVTVEGYLDLVLRPVPSPLDFGAWRGERHSTRRCQQLDLSSSTHADRVALDARFVDVPDDVLVTFTPLDTGSLEPGRQPVLWEACVEVQGCCGKLRSGPTTALVLRGQPAHYHDQAVSVPLVFEVQATGFVRCWWPWLVGIAAVLFLLFLLYGWLSPHDFDEDLTVRVAGSERQLARAASLVLREQPRGRRGFYRNARVCLTAGGDFVASPAKAAVWVEAQSAGATRLHLRATLERKDRRTRKWVAVEAEEADDGVQPNTVYRVGSIYLRFG